MIIISLVLTGLNSLGALKLLTRRSEYSFLAFLHYFLISFTGVLLATLFFAGFILAFAPWGFLLASLCLWGIILWGFYVTEERIEIKHLLPTIRFPKSEIPGYIFLFLLLVLLEIIFLGAKNGPYFGYDEIAYHFPIFVQWIQEGSLWSIYYTVFSGPIAYYPSNMEVLSGYLWLLFGGDQYLFLINFIVAIGIFVTGAQLLNSLKQLRFWRYFLAFLILLTPVFLSQIGTAGVDLFFCWGLLVFWYGLVQKNPWITVFGLGFFLGTKYLGVTILIPFFPIFLWRFWREIFTKKIIIGFLIFLFTGGIWYIRNLILAKNPFFPQDFLFFDGYGNLSQRIWGESIWANFEMSAEFWHTFKNEIFHQMKLLPFLGLAFGATFFFIPTERRKYFWGLYFFQLTLWFIYLTAPFSWANFAANVRYGMPAFLMGLLFIAFVLNELFRIQSNVRSWLFLVALPVFSLFLSPYVSDHVHRFYRPVSTFFIPESKDLYAASQFIRALDSESIKLAYTGLNWHYFFFGKSLQNQVRYININDCQDCGYYEFRDSTDSVRRDPNYSQWLRNLRTHEIDYLVTDIYHPNPHVEIYEKAWAEANPHIFEKIWEQGTVEIYKVKPRPKDLSDFLKELEDAESLDEVDF